MPNAHPRTDPPLLAIERPRCPNCQAGRMMLARIAPGPDGADVRTFECPKCDHVLKVMVEDPLKSAGAYWTSSELNPPK